MKLVANYSKRYDEKLANTYSDHLIEIRYDLICSQCGARRIVLKIQGPKTEAHPCLNCLALALLD